MSNTPIQDHPAQGLSSGSGQTLPSRPLQPSSDPSASKRVCFYKSGDYKFSGHRMVINARTFKTFDALLDALSKKVPLPFGVRTITTPRGTHLVKGLDDLHDGGAYVCSDQKRVKPLNLDEVNRRQVPWNTTRPLSAGRRRRQGLRLGLFGRNNEAATKPSKVMERVAVRTPKRLVVIKNRDPTVKRTIVLQRRTAPTFDALLDYLSQILQFPVLKLYSIDGRRVDGLAALILCSGVVVAAGNEPFRLGNYSLFRTSQMAQAMLVESVEPSMLQPRAQKNKSFSSGRGSRNFSLSSERYIVNQITKSQTGSMNGHPRYHNRPFETEISHPRTPVASCETGRADNKHHTCIMPHDDDIEKSFRVNQDGSMTVEMKVHLTIKEEEMLHWTTTLSRSSLSKRTVCASVSGSGNSSPDSNNAIAKDSSSITEDETKEENYPGGAGKAVGFNDERPYDSYASGISKTSFKRTPTPGPRHVNKKASVESVKTVTESGVQESLLGHYSYMERTADGETTEGYCVVRHSSSSNRPIPKPRKTPSAGTSNKCSNSSIRSSGVAEVLQIQNNGMEVRETVMHIYESQGCYDNYFANEEYSVEGDPLHSSNPAPESKPSTDSGSHVSSNDCDIDCSWQPPTADLLQRQKEEMLSLSSEPRSATQEITNNMSSETEREAKTTTNTETQEAVKKDAKSTKKKKMIRPARNQKASTSTATSSTDRKTKRSISPSKTGKHSSTEKFSSDASMGKKASSENIGQKSKRAENSQSKKDNKMPKKDSALLVSSDNVKRTPPKRQSFNKAVSDSGHNVNTPTARPQMKKNMSDILQTKKTSLSGKKTISKPKSMTENRISPPKKSLDQSESVSMPSLNPSPSEIHQYVENWLEKVSPDAVPYPEEGSTDGAEPHTKVVFQIGADSESDEKTECPTYLDEYLPTNNDPVKKSTSCLSVPHSYGAPVTTQLLGDQRARGLCVSMPSVRVDHTHQESTLRSHKSAEAIGPADDQESSSNILSPKAKIKPVLRQLCSSIQCIRRASDTNNQQITSNLEKSNSLPDFQTQVASVFGSSCKAFLSFLSVMTLRDSLKSSVLGETSQSATASEAMFMMESLQKISAIDDEEEQRASLTDLQSRASSQFRERWKNFQILRERLESEPLSPKVSETEFALDVVSEGGDVFEDQNIDELMDELNMPQELRAEITSTIQQAFYPVDESTFMETDRNQSDSEEDVEQFVKDEETCMSEDITETKQSNDDHEIDPVPDQELQAESEVQAEVEEMRTEENTDVVEECEEPKETDDDGEGYEGKEENEREGDGVEEEIMNDEICEPEEGSDKESVEKVAEVTGDEATADDEEEHYEVEERLKEVADETEEGLVGEEPRAVESAEDTDEREGAEDEEEDEKMKDSNEERESSEEEETETKERKEISKKSEDENEEETGVEEEVENIDDEVEEEEEPEEEESGHITKDLESEGENINDEAEENEESEEEESGNITKTLEQVGENVSEEEEEVEEEEKEKKEEEEDEDLDYVNRSMEEEGERKEEVKEPGHFTKEVEDEEVEERGSEEEEEDEENEIENITQDIDEGEEEEEEEEEREEEEEETYMVTQKDVEEVDEEEEEEEGEQEQVMELVSKESDEAMEENKDEEEDEDKNTEEKRTKGTTDEEEEEESGEDVDNEDEMKNVDNNEKEESEEEKKVVEEIEETIEQSIDDEEERDNDEELHEELECVLEEASYLKQHVSSCEAANAERDSDSAGKRSSEGQCADDKGNGTELETDEGGEQCEGRSNSLSHPVEISQELLDFVNHALQSSSLIFTYDTRGNIRLEPDYARVIQTEQSMIPKNRKDSSYGLKRLPSPSTSDLSDYRPETSESGGYKTQESVDIVSESGEEASQKTSQSGQKSNVGKSAGSFSSSDSGTKASKDLSYFSAASSLKADAEAAPQPTQSTTAASENDSADGVLIDKGRWLLKENHLIRKSPPVSLGMYGHLDSTSVDTGQENTSEESPPHYKTQQSPLAAISSSELEEMAKPLTPKCTYYNMPHGSDSDPFMDDSSIRSGKKDSSRRGVRVSPTIDTSKTWANKNGSLSSFASVEFKVSDRKVHPEGEPSSAVTQPRRTSSGRGSILQAQDSLDTLHVRCGQFCPIL